MRTKAWLFPSLFALLVSVSGACLFGCSTHVGNGNDDGEDMSGPGPRDLSFDNDAFWAQDPPPITCGLDGTMLPLPPVPGGTPDCPDDKNRQGCPCNKPGESASCWPGLRKNRNLGICRDGMTQCVQNEVGSNWGSCEGYTLPVPGASGGSAACECFSAGQWKLDNLVPCFYTINMKQVGAASSVMMGGKPTCISMPKEPLTLPPTPWSTNSLRVDCIGRWKLCYTLKAGDAKNPMASDCTIASVCTQGDYTTANQEQALKELPAWVTTTPQQAACAEQFTKTGGYGEMSVDGLTVTCTKVQKVFNRVNYCPLKCMPGSTDPECKSCNDGGSGSF